MKLRALQLTNFRQHANTAIDFGLGITGIVGPNGTGKTTILEAIAWALYGNEAARGRRDSIRFARAEAKAPVRVELDFELGGHRYRIVRSLASAELFLDGGAQPIANSITSVSEILHRRLGMTRSEFFNTYFTGQKELTVMSSLGPTERAQFLSRVLGYERLRQAQERVRDRRRTLIAELNGVRQAMPDRDAIAQAMNQAADRVTAALRARNEANAAHERLRGEVAAVTPRWETAQRQRVVRQQTLADLRFAEAELARCDRDVQRATADLAAMDAAQTELATLAPRLTPLEDLARERERLDELARHEGRRGTLQQSLRSGEEETAKLRERLAQVEQAPAQLLEATAARDAKRTEVTAAETAREAARAEWVRARQEAETKRDQLRAQYKEIKDHLDRLVGAGEDGVCPTCQRSLGSHFRGVHDSLSDQLVAVKQDGQYYNGRVTQLANSPREVAELDARHRQLAGELEALERRLFELQSAVQTLGEVTRTIGRFDTRCADLRAEIAALPEGYDAVRHAQVKREIDVLAPVAQRAATLRAMTERANVVRAELAAATASREAASLRVTGLREAAGDHAADDAVYEALRLDHERVTAAHRNAEVALARADAEVSAAQEAMARAEHARIELERAEARAGELTRERRLHDELDQAFSDLRTDLNFALRPEVSRLASEFLTVLTNDRFTDLDLDDEYNLVLSEDGIPKPVISGGEEDVANLAVRLAISQMIAERTGQAFSLLILDEVFGSLDEARQRHVMSLLHALHDRFEQVILITHVGNIFDDGDRVLHVDLDPDSGASIVKEGEPVLDERALLGAA